MARPSMQMAWEGERALPIGRNDAARMIRGNRRKARQLADGFARRFVRFDHGVTRIGLQGCDVVAVISKVRP